MPTKDDRQQVWVGTVDDGAWSVEVRRTGDYTGELLIWDLRGRDPEPVHSENVTLSYQALFGPDVADVAEWQDKAIAIIDGQAE